MLRPSRVLFLFAVAFALFSAAPAIFFDQFPPYPLLKWGDIVDLLTPAVLIPLYWLQFRFDRDRPSPLRAELLFLVIAAIWVLGQGMHLAANAIGHLLAGLEDTSAYDLTYFLDEELSHWLWHAGVMGMAAFLAWWNREFVSAETTLAQTITAIAGAGFGFFAFIVSVEGGTVFIGLPFALVMTALLLWRRRGITQRPQLLFTLVAFSIALLAFAAWGLYWGGFPELSEVGLIT